MPFIPISSIYAALVIMFMVYLLYHLGNHSNTQIKTNSDTNLPADTLLVSKTLYAFLLLAFAELNGSSHLLLHFFGLAWWLCITYQVWLNLSKKTQHSIPRFINNATSAMIIGLCATNVILSWPFFALP